jgi:PPK2 family polyphosphate:nucleotide phosphotransferase
MDSATSEIDRYRVAPGSTVDLATSATDDDAAFPGLDKASGRERLAEVNTRLAELQELFAASGMHRLLVVFQAMDTGGKDGAIRNVFRGVNPAGVRVAAFKVPTEDELAHDFLWRVHGHTPRSGEIVIFNRSHYEDVLVVRVHGLVPEGRWRRRYDHINAFEQLLADEGTTVLKFFLHISKDEQRERLQARLDEPTKRWKFRHGDLDERKRWNDYQEAYAEALGRTSTEAAPWWIVPADRKCYRDLVVSTVLVDTLESLDMTWPEPEDLTGVVVE